MFNPYLTLLKWQMSMVEGWAHAMTEMMTVNQKLCAHNLELMKHPSYHRFMNIVPTGADWFDHYGKRNHDVDPTRV